MKVSNAEMIYQNAPWGLPIPEDFGTTKVVRFMVKDTPPRDFTGEDLNRVLQEAMEKLYCLTP